MDTLSGAGEYAAPGTDRWLVLLNGIAAIILGFFMVTNPVGTISALVWFLGLYWLVTGVINLISLVWNRWNWGWKLFMGVLGILAGLLIIRNPIMSAVLVPATAAFWMGVIGILIGISELILAFRGGGLGLGILAALSIIAGILLVTSPVAAGLTLVVILGYLFILDGVISIMSAVFRRMRRIGSAG
ncbi:MAG: hypothetical protein GX495_05795 [Chloroflexi bacterium]|jgi:uncharacterized membrane protein HdeD (DUF308 family)|nr:hypothetical protein [Chloroflexota bacterium]